MGRGPVERRVAVEVERVPVGGAHAQSGRRRARWRRADDVGEAGAEEQHDDDTDHAGDAAAQPVVVDEAAAVAGERSVTGRVLVLGGGEALVLG